LAIAIFIHSVTVSDTVAACDKFPFVEAVTVMELVPNGVCGVGALWLLPPHPRAMNDNPTSKIPSVTMEDGPFRLSVRFLRVLAMSTPTAMENANNGCRPGLGRKGW